MNKILAIVGATGVVGSELLTTLEKRNFPVKELILFSSARSAGKVLKFKGQDLVVRELKEDSFENSGIEIAIFSAGGGTSKKFAPIAAAAGVTVIDNSSAWRYDDEVPLVVPEVNSKAVKEIKKGIIANPNCTTAILLVALYPIYRKFGIRRAIVSTYQATSGGGKAAMDELEQQTQNYLNGQTVSNEKFSYPIPFNLIPQIDVFQDNLYTKEEMKVTWESRKIMGVPDLKISCTAVRIPTFRAHAESVTVETEKPVDINEVRNILSVAPGVQLVDDPDKQKYPMPLTASEKYDVEVGRIRKNKVFGENGLDFFVCGDQLLKGAALNAVQIAELLI